MKLVHLYKELKLLGVKKAFFRLYYEFLNRSGLRQYLQPVKPCACVSKTKYLGINSMTLEKFRGEKKSFFIPAYQDLAVGLSEMPGIEPGKIKHEALLAERGRVKCFSSWYADYGIPINWHLNPVRKITWPVNKHWSKIMKYERLCGDCKLTWEVNRFPHVYTWIRAYVLTKDSRWVRAWTRQLGEWENANPYRAGLNWNSGQELAVRCLSWLAALYVFLNDEDFKEEDFQRLMRLLYLHGEHIYANISFARLAVHNNHLIGEALALFLLGSLFSWMSGAGKWQKKGREILEKDGLYQFYADGGYCQCSHNYHRLALHYYIWACRAAECLHDPLDKKVYMTLEKSLKCLLSMMNAADGRLPNWGTNDGALLCPWTSCDYSDFRPVLNALSYLTTGKRLFEKGPWDEELLWFWGNEAVYAPVGGFSFDDFSSFNESGLYCLRQDCNNFAVFRCGSLKDRFAQADQLHLDIWRGGVNIARDGGSYLYNDEMNYHYHFMGSSSHNTVTVDEQDQMQLIRRFKWLEWVKADNVEVYKDAEKTEISGEHYGFYRLEGKVLHRRKVIYTTNDGMYIIIDCLSQKRPVKHKYELHWLLGPWPFGIINEDKCLKVIQDTPSGKNILKVNVFDFSSNSINSKYTVIKGKEGERPLGWESRYYGVREAVVSVRVSCETNENIYFVSMFCPETGKEKLISGENMFKCICTN